MFIQRPSLYPAFVISLGLHLAILYPWIEAPKMEMFREPIPVVFIPAARPKIQKSKKVTNKVEKPIKQEPKVDKKVVPLRRNDPPKRVTNTRKTHPQMVRKTSPRRTPSPVAKQSDLPEGLRWQSSKEKTKSPREPKEMDRKSIVRSTLPTLAELLPPMDWSATKIESEVEVGAIHLDSKDPNYISYFSSIKRAIELVWEYPPLALNQGIQGKLMVEFTLLGNGNLMEARLIRSSGSSVLDEEALRAVQAAAPFHPIPQWIKRKPLAIIASFEYFDNRLRYRFTPDGKGRTLSQDIRPRP